MKKNTVQEQSRHWKPNPYGQDIVVSQVIVVTVIIIIIIIITIIFNKKLQNLCKIFGNALVSDSTVDTTGTTVTSYIRNCCLTF